MARSRYLLALAVLALLGCCLPGPAALGQDGDAAEEDYIHEFTLRDGSKLGLKNPSIDATGAVGKLPELDDLIIRLPWDYMAPLEAYHWKSTKVLGDQATGSERLDMINWMLQHDELLERARAELEALLLDEPANPAALQLAERLGYRMKDGRLVRRGSADDTADPEPEPDPEPRPDPDGGSDPTPEPDRPTPPRSGPIKVTLDVQADIDWSGEHAEHRTNPTQDAEQLARRYFEQRGFTVVTSGADFAVEIFLKIKPKAISVFFDIPVAAEFTGTASATVSDRRSGNVSRKDVPAVDSTIQRTDVAAALDGIVADLVQRIAAPAASNCR